MGDACGYSSGRSGRLLASAAPVIREVEWTDSIDIALDDPAAAELKPWARRQVLTHAAQLWLCDDGLDRLFVVTRLDLYPTEWAIVYVQGTGLQKFGAHFVDYARRKSWPIRMHTTSKATVRLCRRLGFRLVEYVARCG